MRIPSAPPGERHLAVAARRTPKDAAAPPGTSAMIRGPPVPFTRGELPSPPYPPAFPGDNSLPSLLCLMH